MTQLEGLLGLYCLSRADTTQEVLRQTVTRFSWFTEDVSSALVIV
jgi:hypothetical protein